jgi:hypothetical protein
LTKTNLIKIAFIEAVFAKTAFAKIALIKIALIAVADNSSIDLAINLEICPDFLNYEEIVQT